MQNLRYIKICKNQREIYSGWFDFDLYAKRDSEGRLIEFGGLFAEYINGFCTINLTFLNSFNAEYNIASQIMFSGTVLGGKIVYSEKLNDDPKINYSTTYEIWCDDALLFTGSMRLNRFNSELYVDSIDEDDGAEITEKRNESYNGNIDISMVKQLFASIIDDKNYYKFENIELLQGKDDIIDYSIEELMYKGTFSPKESVIKRGELYKKIIEYESGCFNIAFDDDEYFVDYTIENLNITLNYSDIKYVFDGNISNKKDTLTLNEKKARTISYFTFQGRLNIYIEDKLDSSSDIIISPNILVFPDSTRKLNNLTSIIKEKSHFVPIENDNSLDEISYLDDLVGLAEVKEVFSLFEKFSKYKKILRSKKEYIEPEKQSMHMVFKGNPGTGKTTVAKRVANLLYRYEILSKNNCIVVHRNDLVAEYIGQTETKVQRVIETAIGGVLFIDEAYMLDNESENDYGRIALIQIMNAMETYKDDLVIILAGYKEKMKKLLELNEGLASRIKWFLDFEDYNEDELSKILLTFIDKNLYKINKNTIREAKKALSFLQKELDKPRENKFKFGNGRGVLEFYELMEISLASRMISKDYENMTLDELMVFSIEDVKYAKRAFMKKVLKSENIGSIGFQT